MTKPEKDLQKYAESLRREYDSSTDELVHSLYRQQTDFEESVKSEADSLSESYQLLEGSLQEFERRLDQMERVIETQKQEISRLTAERDEAFSDFQQLSDDFSVIMRLLKDKLPDLYELVLEELGPAE